MSRPDLDTHGLALLAAREDIVSRRAAADWAIFAYGKHNELKLLDSGAGGADELAGKFSSSSIMYGLCRIQDPSSGQPRILLINWVGEKVPESNRQACAGHLPTIKAFFKEASLVLCARRPEEVTQEGLHRVLSRLAPAGGTVSGRAPASSSEELVGTNYRKTNPALEIRRTHRDSFWAQAEREEEQRKEEERRRVLEERRRWERERMEEEKREAAERERRFKEKERLIEEQRKEQARLEAEERRKEKARWEQQQREHEAAMRDRFRRTESIEKAAEAATLVSQRSQDPREFFRQRDRSGSTSGAQSPPSPLGVRPGAPHRPFLRYQRSLTESAYIFRRPEPPASPGASLPAPSSPRPSEFSSSRAAPPPSPRRPTPLTPASPPGTGPSPPPGTGSPRPASPPGTGSPPPASSPGTGPSPPTSPPGTGPSPPTSPPRTGSPPPASPPGTGSPRPASPPGTGPSPPTSPPGTGSPPPASPPGTGPSPPTSPPGTGSPPAAIQSRTKDLFHICPDGAMTLSPICLAEPGSPPPASPPAPPRAGSLPPASPPTTWSSPPASPPPPAFPARDGSPPPASLPRTGSSPPASPTPQPSASPPRAESSPPLLFVPPASPPSPVSLSPRPAPGALSLCQPPDPFLPLEEDAPCMVPISLWAPPEGSLLAQLGPHGLMGPLADPTNPSLAGEEPVQSCPVLSSSLDPQPVPPRPCPPAPSTSAAPMPGEDPVAGGGAPSEPSPGPPLAPEASTAALLPQCGHNGLAGQDGGRWPELTDLEPGEKGNMNSSAKLQLQTEWDPPSGGTAWVSLQGDARRAALEVGEAVEDPSSHPV